jgi:hypothetical protein
MTDAKETIRLARKHLGQGTMESSARLCLADAIKLYDNADYDTAHKRALKSLAYSVGIFHPDYKLAKGEQ